MNFNSKVLLRVTADRNLAEEWELVLLAQGLSPALRPTPDGVEVFVREGEASRARTALLAYDAENARKFVQRNEVGGSASLSAGIGISSIFTLATFWLTTTWLPTVPWFERGGADADRILDGELWRTVTALTLHADIGHAASNAAAGAIFFGMVSGTLGWGLGGALILLAGAGGNLANAALYGSMHFSIGASTAVFGAVGVVSALTMSRYRRQRSTRRRAWLPIAAALALLGMLGSGGGRVDIWAHLCGLSAGVMLGIVVDYLAPNPPEFRTQVFWGSAAVGVLICCWTLALR